jgi:hypothetical protein
MIKHKLTAAAFVAVAGVSTAGGAWLDSARAASPPSVLTPITPCRLLDTRPGQDNIGARVGAIGPNETITLPVVGRNGECDIPSDTTGISTNVTIVAPSENSYLTVFPAGLTPPKASNLNWTGGQPPTANQVTVGLGTQGISVLNRYGNVHVVIDIVGYYTPGGAGSTRVTSPNGVYSLAVTNDGISITSGGTELMRVNGRNVTISPDHFNVTSSLSNTLTAGTSTSITSSTNFDVLTGANATVTTGNNVSVSTGSNMTVTTGNNVTNSIGRDLSTSVQGKTTLTATSSDTTMSGSISIKAGTTMGVTAGSVLAMSTGTDATITAGRALIMRGNGTASSSIVTAGPLTLESGGLTTVKGTNVRVMGGQIVQY